MKFKNIVQIKINQTNKKPKMKPKREKVILPQCEELLQADSVTCNTCFLIIILCLILNLTKI